MEHPCFTAPRVLNGKALSRSETRLHEDGSKEHIYYWIADYFQRHSHTFEWKHDRLPSSFVTTGFHGTLSDYINTLAIKGLVVMRLDEPQPTEEGVRIHPPMAKHYRSPHSIAIETIKISR